MELSLHTLSIKSSWACYPMLGLKVLELERCGSITPRFFTTFMPQLQALRVKKAQ
jgi:hypothetical protein